MPRLWHGHPTREGPKCLGPANKASPMKVKRNSHQRPMNPYSMPMQSPGKLRENQEFCVGFHEGLVGPTKCQQTKPTNKPLSHCKVVLRFLGLSHQTICVCVCFFWMRDTIFIQEEHMIFVHLLHLCHAHHMYKQGEMTLPHFKRIHITRCYTGQTSWYRMISTVHCKRINCQVSITANGCKCGIGTEPLNMDIDQVPENLGTIPWL